MDGLHHTMRYAMNAQTRLIPEKDLNTMGYLILYPPWDKKRMELRGRIIFFTEFLKEFQGLLF